MKIRTSILFLALVCGIIISSCKKDDTTSPGGGTNPTTYAGTFAGATESGSISLTIAGSEALPKVGAIVAVTGTFKRVGGSTISLTGTFNTVNDSLTVTGGTSPNVYTFAGVLVGGVLSGNYAGPAGIGSFTLSVSTNNAVKVFLGMYTSSGAGGSGNFNIVRNGTTITGLAFVAEQQIPLNGFTVAESIKVYIPNSTTVFLGLGMFNDSADTSAHGVYDTHQGDNGTWYCGIAH